ncbi:MAG: aldehyde dehydrogenase (NADP(+)) [Pontibacterium sp.]
MLKQQHFIAGQWKDSEHTFNAEPTQGEPVAFAAGNPEVVNEAAQAAARDFLEYSQTSRAARAEFLRTIADEIDALGDEITQVACCETGLPEAHMIGERGRTVGQLKLFASHIEQGDYLDIRHDEALPDRQPLPRPALAMMQQAIGPVAVFGASNFPLAFSVAGGDTASALAAGCPVVVKGHSAHPGTCDLVAQAIEKAVIACDMPRGVFSLIQGGDRATGQALVQHPAIKAVGFTGSTGGGRALFNLCAARPEPIPFFGELGSVNPLFMMPNCMSQKAEQLGEQWVASLSMGAGQFCTNPGVVIGLAGADLDCFVGAAQSAAKEVLSQCMLTQGMAATYAQGVEKLQQQPNVETVFAGENRERNASPSIVKTTAQAWLNQHELGEEIFGPSGVVVEVASVDEMLEIASALEGQLTATLHLVEEDHEATKALMPILAQKAGRVLANGFPTGVEVCDSMVHGGPYPASTNFGATSVGTLAIRRFLRPVCFQNIPAALLPSELA